MATPIVLNRKGGRLNAVESAYALDTKLSQLGSLLKAMYGAGADGFEMIGAQHRDNLLWLASDLAEEAGRLNEVVNHG